MARSDSAAKIGEEGCAAEDPPPNKGRGTVAIRMPNPASKELVDKRMSGKKGEDPLWSYWMPLEDFEAVEGSPGTASEVTALASGTMTS